MAKEIENITVFIPSFPWFPLVCIEKKQKQKFMYPGSINDQDLTPLACHRMVQTL